MNSLEILKKELIKQKELLDNKGFAVTVANGNPSPSEITSAIEKINFDFTITTATEADVKVGKTFYSQNNELKTGTLDFSIIQKYEDIIATLLSGDGEIDIIIPETIHRLRKYAYYSNNKTAPVNLKAYNAHNFTLPSNIKIIEDYSFAYSNITGVLTIPETCEYIGNYAFRNASVDEVIINGGIITTATNYFFECPNLIKATINQLTPSIPNYMFKNCKKMEELYLPPSLTSLDNYCLENNNEMKIIKFTSINPPALAINAFAWAKKALILIPFESYYNYVNATNYQYYPRTYIGYKEFEASTTLPSEDENYTYTWYSTLDDVRNSTNPVTSCAETGTYYAVCTEITT